MPSLIVCRLFFFIFFGSVALIRRANSDENGGFGKTFPLRDEDRKFNTLRQLFPMEDSSVDAMKSLIYDVSGHGCYFDSFDQICRVILKKL